MNSEAMEEEARTDGEWIRRTFPQYRDEVVIAGEVVEQWVFPIGAPMSKADSERLMRHFRRVIDLID